MKYPAVFFVIGVLTIFLSCRQKTAPLSEEYIKQIEVRKQQRDSSLRSEDGYINLVGLYWLKEGENTFGSLPTNTIIFPKNAPKSIGSFILKDRIVTFINKGEVKVKVDSVVVDEAIVYDASHEINPTLEYKNFRWIVIERSGNFGVRLRDINLPATKKALNIPSYPLSKEWIIEATFRPFKAPVNYSFNNILGFTFDQEIRGKLTFKKNGVDYSFLPIIDENGIFIMFADGTSGKETYGAGRYLTADFPNKNNEVILDFNKAYNPPCAFTEYATCPLPPKENLLILKVKAGEKYATH